VMLADGGRCISDLVVLRDQLALFGAVASTATVWRVLDAVDGPVLSALRAARAPARDRLWAHRAETTGRPAGTGLAGAPGRDRGPCSTRAGHRPQREAGRGADIQGRLRSPGLVKFSVWGVAGWVGQRRASGSRPG
jgi:hypothetical protein